MKYLQTILALFGMLFAIVPAKAEEVDYDYIGYPTIIHSESADLQAWRPKFWNLHIETMNGEFINMDYRLAGDTLLLGKHYVRVVFGFEEKADLYKTDFMLLSDIRPNGDNYADTLYYRQEGDKVFCLQPKGNDEVLIIDYGLKVGDDFTDANGNTYTVTDTGRQNNNKYFFAWYYNQPKSLKLISKQTGEEDIWIEGIGSAHWGITPYFLMERNRVFTRLKIEPHRAQVFMGYGGNLLLLPKINTECYKAERITGLDLQDADKDYFVKYEFIGDTLCVNGAKVFQHVSGYLYAECLIDNGQIDFMVKGFWPEDVAREDKRAFEVKIPGFKAGTYQVGMPGQEYVTLECKGSADGIEAVQQGPVTEGSRAYDLQGRPVSGKQRRGLYIRDRRVWVAAFKLPAGATMQINEGMIK